MLNNLHKTLHCVGVRSATCCRLPLTVLMALLLLLAMGLNALALTSGPTKRPESITVVLDENYPPYVFHDEDGQLRGILVEQWQAWEKVTGVRVNLVAKDWGDAQQFMREGHADVIDTMFRTEERDTLYSFGTPYATIDLAVLHHKSLGGISDISSLRGFTVGVKAGGAIIGVLRKADIKALKEYASDKDIIDAAVNGEIRVFSVDMQTAVYFLGKRHAEADFRQAFVLHTGQFHRAVKKGDEDILRLVEAGFAAIPDSTLRRIDHRWLGTPLGSQETWRRMLLVFAGVGGLALVMTVLALVFRRRVRAKMAEIEGMLIEMREREDRFRSVFNSVSDMIFIYSWPEGKIIDANNRACETLRYTHEGLLRLSVGDLSPGIAPFDQAHAMEHMRKAAEGSPQTAEWLLKTRDERLIWVEASVHKALVLGQEHILVSARDISERKEALTALNRSELLNRKIIEASPFCIMILNAQERLTFANKGCSDHLGLDAPEALLGRNFEDFWNEADREALKAALQDAREGRLGNFLGSCPVAEGSAKWWDVHITVLGEEASERYLVISHDVTLCKLSEQLLIAKEALLQAMLRNLPFDFWARDTEQRLLLQSLESVRLWGDLAADHADQARINQRYRDQWQDTNARALAGEVVASDLEYVLPTGERRLYHALVAPIISGESVLGVMGINIDITERALAESALGENRRLLESILNALPQSIFWKDRQSVYQGCNQAFARSVGEACPQDVIGKTDVDMPWLPNQSATCRAVDRQVMDSREPKLNRVELLRQRDGRQTWMAISKLPLLNGSGEAVGVIGIYEDIMKRKLAQKQLEEAWQALDDAGDAGGAKD